MKIVHDIGFNPSKEVEEGLEPRADLHDGSTPMAQSESAIVKLKESARIDELVRKVMDMDGYDADRLEELEQAVKEGRYEPDLETAADRLVEESLLFAGMPGGE